MATMKALPWAQFFANSRRYTADGEGRIEGVVPTDVAALVAAGAILVEPFSHKPDPPPEKPKPPEPQPTIWMRGVKGAAYKPIPSNQRVTYRCNGEGYVLVHPEHVRPMQNAGCQVMMEQPAPKPAA